MLVLFCSAVVMGAAVFLLLRSRNFSMRVGASEEAAHSAAVKKRHAARRERRHSLDRPAFASVLGETGPKKRCRIVNVSRSGMRIAAAQDFGFPAAAQVQVHCDGEFFVGNVCYLLRKGGEQICGLQLVASSCARLPGGLLPDWDWVKQFWEHHPQPRPRLNQR